MWFEESLILKHIDKGLQVASERAVMTLQTNSVAFLEIISMLLAMFRAI